jgi:outer membrane lipase/esterase
MGDFGNKAPSQALYVLELGASDVRDSLVAGGDPSIIGAGLKSIANNITALYLAGARKFLVLNVPNIGVIPSVRVLESQFPGITVAAQQLTLAFDGGLDATIAILKANLPDADIARFDLYASIASLVGNPSAYGLTNVTDP